MKTICGKENTFVVTLDDTFRKKNVYYMVEFFQKRANLVRAPGQELEKYIFCA